MFNSIFYAPHKYFKKLTENTVLCKSNESEFRRISRHFATFRRKPTIFLTKRNIAELSTNFRKRYCLDTFEISKLYTNVPAKLRTTIREDLRNFEGNVSNFRSVFRSFEVQRIFEAKLARYIVQCKKAFASFDQAFA